MRVNKIGTRVFVFLLLAAYCGTIPVLSVVHWHQFYTVSRSSAFNAREQGRTSEENPLCCATCARIASSLSFVTPVASFPAIRPIYETSYRYCESGFVFLRYTPCLNRAPPSDHPAC